VSTLLYLPYCVFNIASPALSVLYGITGFRIEKTEPVVDTSPEGTPLKAEPDTGRAT
jgi:NhaC family Na+:H+ antiporter